MDGFLEKIKNKDLRIPSRFFTKIFKFGFLSFISATVIVGGFFIFRQRLPVSAETKPTFKVVSGTDTTSGVSTPLSSDDIVVLSANDGSLGRMRIDGFWPNSGAYDESKYVEFVFGPNVPETAVIQKVELINDYRKSSRLLAAKLEIWNGSEFHEQILSTGNLNFQEITQVFDLTSDFDTPAKINNLTKIRFLAYTDTGPTYTDHDYIGLTVSYNFAPTTENQSVTLIEEATTTIGLAISDQDSPGDAFSFISVTPPQYGVLSGFNSGAKTIVYTPNLDYNGSDFFTYQVNDGIATSNSATVSLTIDLVNDAPILSPIGNQSVNELGTLAFTASSTDVDGDILTFSLTSTSTGASIGSSTGVFSWTPTEAQGGNPKTDYTFTVNVSDGNSGTDSETITITVNEVNTAPTVADMTLTTNEDIATTTTLSATDVDLPTNSLVFSIVATTTHGSAVISDNQLTYTPSANYYGSDSLTYRVYDGVDYSNTATVNINVASVNDAPVLEVISNKTIDELVAFNFTATSTDVDGDILFYSLTSTSTGASIDSVTGVFSWTPSESQGPNNYTFTVVVSDGILTDSKSFTAVVNEVNTPPLAADIFITTDEDIATSTILSAVDSDEPLNPLTYSFVTLPVHGTSTISGNQITYIPDFNYNGSDSFSYKVNDGTADSNIATAAITVVSVNDSPILNFIGSSTINELETLTFTASSTDVDFDIPIYSLSGAPEGAVISSSTGVFSWTPTEEQGGNPQTDYSFTVNVSDGQGGEDSEIITVTVNEVNTASTANNGTATTNEDTAVEIIFSADDSDLPANTLTYSIVSQPSNGSLGAVFDDKVIYTPSTNFNGADSFTFKVNDGIVDSNIATSTITINAVNDAPVAVNIATSTDEEIPVIITLSGADNEGQSLTFATTTSPGHGILTFVAANQVNYTPELNFNGTDSFTYKANDGSADSAPATVTITVNPVNDTPTVASSTMSRTVDDSFTITLSGSDIDGDTLSYAIVNSTSTYGSFGAISGNTVVYTPTGVLGTDTFTFKANDGTVDSDIATTTINLTHGVFSKLNVNASPKRLPTASDSEITVTGQDKFGNTATTGYSSSTKWVILSTDNGGELGNTTLNLKSADGVATTTLTKSSPGVVHVTVSSASGSAEPDKVNVTFTALIVNNIRSNKTYATADGTYKNGWQWIFDVTIPAEEYRVKMKFSDWVSGTSTIAVADNIRFYSPQSSNASSTATAKTIAAADDWKGNVDFDEGWIILYFGNDATFAGVQIQMYVEAKIPVGSPSGIYSADYGIKTVEL